VDITAVSTGLSSLKTAFDIVRLLKESDLSLEKSEIKLKLAELTSALADARIELANVCQILSEKDGEIRRLKDRIATAEKVYWKSPSYWVKSDSCDQGPFCQHCYDCQQALVRLQGNGEGWWECKACKNTYTDESYKTHQKILIGAVRDRSSNPW